jgi:hypothetical protein
MRRRQGSIQWNDNYVRRNTSILQIQRFSLFFTCSSLFRIVLSTTGLIWTAITFYQLFPNECFKSTHLIEVTTIYMCLCAFSIIQTMVEWCTLNNIGLCPDAYSDCCMFSSILFCFRFVNGIVSVLATAYIFLFTQSLEYVLSNKCGNDFYYLLPYSVTLVVLTFVGLLNGCLCFVAYKRTGDVQSFMLIDFAYLPRGLTSSDPERTPILLNPNTGNNLLPMSHISYQPLITTVLPSAPQVVSIDWVSEETDNEALQCSICWERKKDLSLDCGHTLCTECARSINENQNPQCPECRASFSLIRRVYI